MAKIKVKGSEIAVFTQNEAGLHLHYGHCKYKNPDGTDD